ncbi:MAG: hypothetical protein IJW32_00040 [Clostridia bacterium]|nr:hypothetical protein [Clostridia bacterium]
MSTTQETLTIVGEYADNIDFYYEWLRLEKIQLELLILTSVLAENNLAYRGTLATMCEWLGRGASAKNNKIIKEALEILQNKKFINYYKEGNTYVIAITNAGMKTKDILRVRKVWINTFKKYKSDVSVSWLQLVRVFVYICATSLRVKGTLIIKQNDVAEALKVSTSTVGKALKCIAQCDLDGIYFKKDIAKEVLKDFCGNTIAVINTGTSITIGYNWI